MLKRITLIIYSSILSTSLSFAQHWQEHYDPDTATPFTFGGYFKGLLVLGVIYFIIKTIFPNFFDD
jgi:hypothetical protein|tara:strand:+ start:1846 stop:2043 length:198 start_codon:yes stop_codon:yes gene_type:complete